MPYLFENPLPIVMVGLVLLTFTGVLYFTTRSVGSFVASVVVIVLTLSALVMEQIVYTEREMVEVAITGITAAVEENDLERVLTYLAPTAKQTRALAKDLMPQLEITRANITSEIEISLDDEQAPTTATARFRGFFHARHTSGATGGRVFPVEVRLVRGEHRWLIESFTSDDDFKSQAERLRR